VVTVKLYNEARKRTGSIATLEPVPFKLAKIHFVPSGSVLSIFLIAYIKRTKEAGPDVPHEIIKRSG
jgi:hypothetical protein